MKLKLLTICVIALLLFTVVPTAVAAKPVAKITLRDNVYASLHVPGPKAGKITIDLDSGQYSCSLKKLEPPTLTYTVRAFRASTFPATEDGVTLFTPMAPDAHGRLSLSGSIGPTELAWINDLRTSGDDVVFVVAVPVVPPVPPSSR